MSDVLLVLVCESCGRTADTRAVGWRAFHGAEDDDSLSVVVFCPGCAQEVDDDA